MNPLIAARIIVIAIALTGWGIFLLSRAFYNAIDRRIGRFQSELIENQIRETRDMYRQVRGWRHDYRNHIQNMKIQLSENNYAALDR